MSSQNESLHRSISHSASLQNNIPIIPLFAFPPPESPHINTSTGMNSDTYLNTVVYHTISQFKKSDLETLDEFKNSEPIPSIFSQPLCNPSTPKPEMTLPQLPLIFQTLHPRTHFSPMNAPTIVPQMTHKYHMN